MAVDMVVRVRFVAEAQQAIAANKAYAVSASQTAAATTHAARQTAASASAIQHASSVAGKALLIGVGAGLAISAKAAIDFQSSFAGIRKTVDASEAQFSQLEGTMRGLAKVIPINVNELNRIGELGGQLGIGVDALESFTETVAKLSVTTNLTTESASTSLARLAKILTIPATQFNNMGSSIVDLGNNFATTESEIVNFGLRIAPVGAIVGMTGAQVLALAAAFTSVGVPAERGGTAVQKSFTIMQDAVLSGGDKLEVFARTASMTAEEFAEAFSRDPARAFDEFLKGLNRIDEAGGNVFEVLRNVGLANERTVQSLLAVANAEGVLTDALGMSEGAWDANNALNEEAQKRFDTTASKIQLAMNHINDLRIAIGQNLLPMIGGLAEGVGDLVDWIESWNDATKTAVGQTLLWSAGIIAAWKAVGLLSKVIGVDLVRNLVRASGATLTLTTRSANLIAVFGRLGIAGAVFLAVGAMTDFIGQQVEATRKTADLVEALKQEQEGIEGVVDAQIKSDLFEKFGVDIYRYFSQANVSIDQFVAKIKMGADVTADLGRVIETAQRSMTNTRLGPFQLDFGDTDRQRLSAFLGAVRQEFGLLADATEIDMIRAREATAAWYREFSPELERVRGQLGTYDTQQRYTIDGLEVLGETAEDAADSFQEAADKIRDLADAQLGVRDAGFGWIDAIRDLSDAQAAYNEVGGDTLDNGLALQQSWTRLVSATRNFGTQGLEPLLVNLREMFTAGAITSEQFVIMSSNIQAMAPLVSQAAAISSSSLSAFANSANVDLGDVDATIDEVIASLYMMGMAAGTTIGALSASVVGVRYAMGLIASGVPMSVTEGMQILSGLQAQMTTSMANLGASLPPAFAAGMGGGGGGGSISDVVESEIDKAIRIASEGTANISAAIRAGLDIRSATDDVREAEKKLADLREERANLPAMIAQKERELAAARRASAEVTLDEQKAIEDSLEAYKRAQKAFAQGVITATDLAIAERDYHEAIAQSTAMSPEVAELKEEIQGLRDRKAEIRAEIREVKDQLIAAQLELIQRQLDLVEAGQQFVDMSYRQKEAFRRIAEAAGLTKDQVKHLIRQLTNLAAMGFTDFSTTIPTPPPAVPSFHRSGVVGGMPGRETLIRALPGEIVFNPANTSGLGTTNGGFSSTISGGIHIHLQGVWDLTKPDQVDRVMNVVETQLRTRARGKR